MWNYFKLTVWAIFWLMLLVVMIPFRKKRDNCLTWAQRKQDNEGGYLVIRWCRTSKVRWLRWPHFLWMSDNDEHCLQHYIPKEHAHTEKLLPRPWFDGVIKYGDKDKDEN